MSRISQTSRGLHRMNCCHSRENACNSQAVEEPQNPAEIRRLRHRLFAFIYNKQKPTNYTYMVRYLLRWKVSVYSLLWMDVLLWAVLYTIVNAVYRFALDGDQQRRFSRLVESVATLESNVPVTFLLGFYVTQVVTRWWAAYLDIPKMGTTALRIEATVFNKGNPKRAEQIRITISRYLNLAWVLCMWKVSEMIKKRFRLLRNLVTETSRVKAKQNSNTSDAGSHHFLESSYNAGHPSRPALQQVDSEKESIREEQIMQLMGDLELLNQDPVIRETYGRIISASEMSVYEERARQVQGSYSIEHELPLHWAVAVAQQALAEGFIRSYDGYEYFLRSLCEWSSRLGTINKYANMNLPVVYTQVVIIAVYSWFFFEVVASQNLTKPKPTNTTRADTDRLISIHNDEKDGYFLHWMDLYVPVFALFKLLFVLGWFKVAFILMDPYAADVDDLPFSDILNSNLRKGSRLVGFKTDLYPRKLRRAMEGGPPGNYLHSDEEQDHELDKEQSGLRREVQLKTLDFGASGTIQEDSLDQL